jgi:hypothetical protein
MLSEEAPNETRVVERVTNPSYLKGIITQRCENLDDIFKRYTVRALADGNL